MMLRGGAAREVHGGSLDRRSHGPAPHRDAMWQPRRLPRVAAWNTEEPPAVVADPHSAAKRYAPNFPPISCNEPAVLIRR